MSKIGVIGLGFVGLTTAVGFSSLGFKVYCFETNELKSDKIKKLDVPFHEPSLNTNLKKQLNKNLYLVDGVKEVIINSDIIFVCVGTPAKKNGASDLSYINKFFNELENHRYNAKKIICIKSTVPPGTCLNLSKKLKKNRDFAVSFTPEFLREGHAWKDFMKPDRIVIGSENHKYTNVLKKIFSKFHTKIIFMNLIEAEFVKYLSNNLLATLISFSNEMSMVARNTGNINLKNLFDTLHLDKRWTGKPANMSSYVYPGIGYGGYCLPKDLKAMIQVSTQKKHNPLLLKAVNTTNNKIMSYNLKKINESIKNKSDKIGIIGLSFKKGSDDIRESPSIFYLKNLLKNYKHVSVFDELANDNFRTNYPMLKLNYYENLSSMIKYCDTLIILVDQEALKGKIIRKKNIIDLRYIY